MKVVPVHCLKCWRCYHNWVPRKRKVYACPKCKSPRWNEAAERKEDERLARGEKR